MTPINFPARFPPLLSKVLQDAKKVRVNEHDWAALWLVDWLLRITAWQIFRETISINNFSSERVDSKGLYGRWRLRVMGSWHNVIFEIRITMRTERQIIFPRQDTPRSVVLRRFTTTDQFCIVDDATCQMVSWIWMGKGPIPQSCKSTEYNEHNLQGITAGTFVFSTQIRFRKVILVRM